MEPPSGGTFPATFECYLQVLIPVVAMQHQPHARKHLVLIARRRVKIPEKIGIRRNAKPTFTQHTKGGEHCNSG
jgi:hypothetical protein